MNDKKGTNSNPLNLTEDEFGVCPICKKHCKTWHEFLVKHGVIKDE